MEILLYIIELLICTVFVISITYGILRFAFWVFEVSEIPNPMITSAEYVYKIIRGDWKMSDIPSSLENNSFLFADKDGKISYLKLNELSETQLEEFISKFSEYARQCISEKSGGNRYGK